MTGHVLTTEGEELGLTSKGRDPSKPQILIRGEGAVDIRFDDGTEMRVEGDWTPGDTVTTALIDGQEMSAKVETLTEGFRIRYRGADLDVKVRTPRAAELARLMPVKLPPDTSQDAALPDAWASGEARCGGGDEVQEGQALCTVEAMKMENVLRAERQATVKRVAAQPGASLAVDEVILEFE